MSDQLSFGDVPEPEPDSGITGKYFGRDATPPERESGIEIELRAKGPLKPNSVCHRHLKSYADGQERTSYEAAYMAEGDYHYGRREAERLVKRGYIENTGNLLPNPAPSGRPRVTAYRITDLGRAELRRLG